MTNASPLVHLRCRTECSFGYAVGKPSEVLAALPARFAAITDRHSTWGHVRWAKACQEIGKVPLFGVELACVSDMENREREPANYVALLARNGRGLRTIYETVTLATEHFYHHPRVDYKLLLSLDPGDVYILTGPWHGVENFKGRKNVFLELGPMSFIDTPEIGQRLKLQTVAASDNLYPRLEDRALYEVILNDHRQMRTAPAHLINRWEWLEQWPEESAAIARAHAVAEECAGVELPKGTMVKPKVRTTLRAMCDKGARARGTNLKDPVYKARLERELVLIAEKKFEDYFYVVADMINWAKKRMFVGPARGSSCGSLVCYLIGITDIDPIPFDLLFERFIDINREDYPDIDIDFQDDKRDLVFDYIREKYGDDRVARLGTLNFFKAKSAIGDCAKALGIPQWEVQNLKDSIIERSTGDSRAQFCILDTFEQLEIGRATLKKYPELALAGRMEGHARHTGMHAAGILITAEPVTNYCAINQHTGTAMLDKYDAEKLGLLKIDALGLRTLSILQDTLDQLKWTREKLQAWPLDDVKAFKILNDGHFAGVFQFEGYALQSICKQLTIEGIEDIITITALARPGPLSSGGTTEFLKRRTGKEKTTYLHPLARDITRVTYGVIVYQEQVMQIARKIGALSWEDVSQLRKAMSKSLGKEFFDQYWEKFWVGARAKKIKEEAARHIWDNINTMGSWAFNRSHAVAYGMMSYWCLILKAHAPLEFAAACLRNAKDDEQSIKILRELSIEGYRYKPFDAETSVANWSVQRGVLVGGLTAIKGVGEKLAANILRKRASGLPLGRREAELLKNGTTPWDSVFEGAEKWAHILAAPGNYGIESRITKLEDIKQESNGTFVFIAKVMEKNLRDHNELKNLAKRSGKRVQGQSLFLNLTLEDDSGSIIAQINRFRYVKWGLPIVEEGKIGDWYIWKGENRAGFRKIYLERWRKLTGNPRFASPLATETTEIE